MKAGQATSLRTKSGFSTVLTTSPGYSRGTQQPRLERTHLSNGLRAKEQMQTWMKGAGVRW